MVVIPEIRLLFDILRPLIDKNEDVATHGCLVLAALSCSDTVETILVENGALKLATTAMGSWPRSMQVQNAGLVLLYNISHVPANRNRVRHAGGLKLAISACATHSECAQLQQHGRLLRCQLNLRTQRNTVPSFQQ